MSTDRTRSDKRKTARTGAGTNIVVPPLYDNNSGSAANPGMMIFTLHGKSNTSSTKPKKIINPTHANALFCSSAHASTPLAL